MFARNFLSIAICALALTEKSSADNPVPKPLMENCAFKAQEYVFTGAEVFHMELYEEDGCINEPVQTISSTQRQYRINDGISYFVNHPSWCFPVLKSNDKTRSLFFRALHDVYTVVLNADEDCPELLKNALFGDLSTSTSLHSVVLLSRV
jgi:hypothetical protein